jgi:hypothetical protein
MNKMERVFFVKNGELSRVNDLLQKGAKIKMIQPVCEAIAAYGYGKLDYGHDGSYVGDIYAYVVVEFD